MRARGDVADAVRAGAARRDADLVQLLVDRAHVLERHPVDLDVLARGDVRDAAAAAVGDVVQAVHLGRRQHAARNLDPLHVTRVVELVIQPVAEPHRAKLFGRDRTGAELIDAAGVAGDPFAERLVVGMQHVSYLYRNRRS